MKLFYASSPRKTALMQAAASFLLFIIALFSYGPGALAQGGAKWSESGNDVTGTSFFGTTNAFDIQFRTNNIERMSLLTSGRLLLGNNTSTDSPDLQFKNVNSLNGGLIIGINNGSPNGNNGIIKLRENRNLLFFTNDLERMRIDNTGNVGINVASPLYSLDVGGGVNAQQYLLNGVLIDFDLINNNISGLQSSVSNLQSTVTAQQTAINDLQTAIDNIEPSPWSTSGNDISYTGGNVGIGTSSPASKLHVNGGDASFSTGSGNITTVITESSGHGNIRLRNSSGITKVDLWGNSGGAAGSYFHQSIFIDQNFAARVQHTSNDLEYFNASNSNGNVISLSDASGHGRARLFPDGAATATVDLNASGSSYLNGGRVGIGTTSPSSSLDIKGTNSLSSDYVLKVQNSDASGILKIRNDQVFEFSSVNNNTAGNIFSIAATRSIGNNTDGVDIYYTDNASNAGNISALRVAMVAPNLTGVGRAYGIRASALGIDECYGGELSASGSKSNFALILKASGGNTNNVGIYVPDQAITGAQKRLIRNDDITLPSSHYGDMYLGTFGNAEAKLYVLGETGKKPLRIDANAISNALVVSSAATIGIGTDAPDEYVHLKKNEANVNFRAENLATTGFMSYQLKNDAGVLGLFWMDGSGKNTYGGTNSVNIGNISNNNFSIVTNNVSRLFVTGEGNVGIGSSSPSEKLSVVGSISATGEVTADAVNTIDLNVSGQTSFENLNVTQTIKVGTNSLFIGGSPTPGNDNNIYSTNGPLLIQDGSTENTLINPTGGWLGIGTTAPKTNVDIRGHLNIQNGNQAAVVYFPNTGGSSPNLYFRSDDDPTTYEPQSERLIIKADGKIGIGTTDPASTLDVAGNIHASAKISASAFTSNSPLPFEAPQGVERMRIDDISGNVGVNTTQPSEKLEVKGGNIRVDDAYDLLLRNSHHGIGWYGATGITTSKLLFANADIDGPVLYGYSGGALGAKNNSENIALRWDGNGNVGIGIYGTNGNGNGPHAKLEVRGTGGETVRISNSSPYNSGHLAFENNAGTRGLIGTSAIGNLFSSNAVNGALAIRGTDGVQIGVTSTAVITVLSDAVGIGTISPSFPLDVCGTVRAKKFNVDVNAGCDFVFEPTYALLPLKKRKEITLLDHHLLNVPPASEMVQGGLDVEKTTLGILQNTEEHELFLYDHDERIEAVENENKEMKKLLLEQKNIMEIQQGQIEEMKSELEKIKADRK